MPDPQEMPPIFLTPAQEQAVTHSGHHYAKTRAEAREVKLGNPKVFGNDCQMNWTKPTYYAYGYQAIFKTRGEIWKIKERHFDKNSGQQIGIEFERTLSDEVVNGRPKNIVDRLPGIYISIYNPYPNTVLIDADKDFGGGEQ